MDMVLYSMIKKEIDETPKDKVDNVGGYEIRFVDSIPTTRNANTIYFIMGESKDADKIAIGKQGLSNIVIGDHIVDFGMLNGNVFLDRYDDNRDIHRELFDVTTEPIVCTNSAPYEIKKFILKGNGAGDVVSILLGEQSVWIGKTMLGVYDGVTDELNMITGMYTQRLETATITDKIIWQHIGLTSDGFREFKATSYSGSKPSFLKTNGLFDVNQNACQINLI